MSTGFLNSPMPPILPPSVTASSDEPLYEVVNGIRVELPPMSILATLLASELYWHMYSFLRQHRLGTAVVEANFILLAKPEFKRRPDVAFVSKERWSLEKPIPTTGDWLVVPDLAIECLSTHDVMGDVLKKLAEYFRFQVRQVWVIEPRERLFYVYQSPTNVTVLTANDTLDGGDILPGFRLPLAELFRQPVADQL